MNTEDLIRIAADRITQQYSDEISQETSAVLGSMIILHLPISSSRSVYIGPASILKDTLDHQECNTYYQVINDDPIQTRYLLTQSFMDRLVQLRNMLGFTPTIRFIGSRVYICLHGLYTFRKIDFTDIHKSVSNIYHDINYITWILEILSIDEHHIINNLDPR